MPQSPRSSLPVVLALVLLLVAPLILGSCGSSEPNLDATYALAAGPTGRGAAGQELRRAYFAKSLTLQDAIDYAHRKVEDPADRQAAVFALAVLDLIEMLETEIDLTKLNELFWIRVGTLAGNAAAIAYGLNPRDSKLASALVEAGTERWRTESYWLAHTDHDALVAMIMHEQGRSAEALARLRSRPDFDEHRLAAIKFIEDDVRRKRGG